LFEGGHQTFYLAPPLLEHKELSLLCCETTPQGLSLRFAEIDDRAAAHEVLGRALLLKTADLSDAALEAWADKEGGIFPEQGFEVYSDEGVLLGTLSDKIETGANLVWVVEGAPGELLLPVIDDLQIQRDDATRRVTVHLLDGLLEANR